LHVGNRRVSQRIADADCDNRPLVDHCAGLKVEPLAGFDCYIEV
jgi:hypothetical protein